MKINKRRQDPKISHLALAGIVIVCATTILSLRTFVLSDRNKEIIIENVALDSSSSPAAESFPTGRTSSLESLALLIEESSRNDNSNCTVNPPSLCNAPACPLHVFAASYPGSGAELLRSIVETLTGLRASEVYVKDDIDRFFFIKTHTPLLMGFSKNRDVNARQIIYLIRNPLWSLPSYFNFIYEMRNGLKSHSKQAPEDEWIEWRDKNFNSFFKDWIHHVEYWVNRSSTMSGKNDGMLIVPYESLTSSSKGPLTCLQVGQFLESSTKPTMNLTVSPPHQMRCLWKAVVKDGRSTKRKAKQYTPAFTSPQRQRMSRSIQALRQNTKTRFPTLDQALQNYIEDIQATSPLSTIHQPKSG